jgi:hypothetical protein
VDDCILICIYEVNVYLSRTSFSGSPSGSDSWKGVWLAQISGKFYSGQREDQLKLRRIKEIGRRQKHGSHRFTPKITVELITSVLLLLVVIILFILRERKGKKVQFKNSKQLMK